MIKKKISPDAFIYPAFKALDLSGQDDAMVEKFREVYKDRIQELFDEFLFLEAIERLSVVSPALKSKIEDTPLSNRAKNCLKAESIETVANLVQYSNAELRSFRGMGAETVKEIEGFVASLGI